MQSKWAVHIALASVGLIYGANYVIAKGIMPEKLNAEAFTLFRISWGMLAFLFIHSLFIREKIKHKRDYLRLIAGGFFGIFFNQLIFFKGLSLGSAANASIIMTVTPIIVLVLSYFLLKEKISLRKGIGIVLGLSGTLLLLFNQKPTLENDAFLGNLFVFLNACSFGTFLVITKPLMLKYRAETVTKWIFIFGWLMILPYGIKPAFTTDYSLFETTTWLSLIYVLVFTTTLAYLLNIKALKVASPTLVAYYIYLQPVFANFISIDIGTDQWEWPRFFFSLLIFIGVFLVSKKTTQSRNMNLR